MNTINAAESASHGNWYKAERELPIPVLKNLLQGADGLVSGELTTPEGTAVAHVTPQQAVASMLGLPLTNRDDTYDALDQYGYQRNVRNMVKQRYTGDLLASMREPGEKSMAKKGAKILDSYNKAAPWATYLPTGADLERVMKEAALSRMTPQQRIQYGMVTQGGYGVPSMPQIVQ